jgi:hypothetical protein
LKNPGEKNRPFPGQAAISSLSTTRKTPRAENAALTAASRSARECALPRSRTTHRALYCVLSGKSIKVAGQGCHAVLDHDADTRGVDGRVAGEFVAAVGLESAIGFHADSVCKKQCSLRAGLINFMQTAGPCV